MYKTSVYLTDDLRRGLERTARATGQSQAVLIRDALRWYLADRSAPWPESIGRHRSGETFPARDDEEELAAHWGRRGA